MDFRDSYNIFVFIILLLLICLIKPLIMLVIILTVSVYIPCHFIKISSVWISLLIVVFMLSLSFGFASILWNKAIINGNVFAHTVYTKTSEAVKTLDHKFEKYLKFVAKTRDTFNAIIEIPNNIFSKFIGIVICWIILAIKNPFLEITQWLR